ncbi:MAG: hypothetical protein EOO80_00535 [Oxalobacteraceae bacterium]|nr:MAG: hypothetical protein EOO80_00535 [Oxalobacteraceae bacterium]
MTAFTSTTRTLFAGLAALTFAAAPAFAQAEELERVEVHGRMVDATPRTDVHAACANLDEQVGVALYRAWREEARYGEVNVQLVVQNGEVGAAEAKGISTSVARKVRSAMHRLDCSQKTAGTQVYRFTVDFINPNAPASRETRTAGTTRIRVNG